MPYCKHVDNGKLCRHGCIIFKGKAHYVCHQFMKGYCYHSGKRCKRGLHSKPNVQSSSGSAERPASETRGDGFRPYKADSDDDKTLKGHLRVLGLSQFCEDLLDYDATMIDSIYRKLAPRRHPDKSLNDDSNHAMVQLTAAKDYVKQKLPLRVHWALVLKVADVIGQWQCWTPLCNRFTFLQSDAHNTCASCAVLHGLHAMVFENSMLSGLICLGNIWEGIVVSARSGKNVAFVCHLLITRSSAKLFVLITSSLTTMCRILLVRPRSYRWHMLVLR